MQSMRIPGAFAAALLLAACAPGPAGARDAAAGEAAAATVPLSIATKAGKIAFQVEVARTPEEQARGLMYRTSLAEDRGMIFPMVPPRFASFWMKNTYIPLDLIFIRTDGSIARIAANAVPEDLSPIPSGEPVAAVLEIAGGGAARHGIVEGDRVSWAGQ